MLGLIGKKLGMTQVFDATGKLIPVTVVQVVPNVVVGKKTSQDDGYDAIVVGAYQKKRPGFPSPTRASFPRAWLPPGSFAK